jgi:hypothetical protein
MNRLLLLSFFALLAAVARAAPAKLDALVTAGTSVRLNAASPDMAYVVWSPPAPVFPASMAVSVWLQPNSSGQFSRVAVVQSVKDEPAVALLLARSAALGLPASSITTEINTLLATWQPRSADIRPDKSLAPDLAALPLSAKIARALQRAADFPSAATALRQMAITQPALRMALGQAWAGPIPPGNPSTIELRRHDPATNSDSDVLGRVTLTPGSGIPLTTPAPAIQVPDLTPSGDLTIKLRWSVPDALRRQLHHTTGFILHRILKSSADRTGFSANPTLAQLKAFAAANPSAYALASISPIPAAKLMDAAQAADFSPVSGDPSTFFFADRDPSFSDGLQFYYYLTARDLLGRDSEPSSRALGRSCRTIPPDVPSDLTASDEVLTSGAFKGQRRIVLRWSANNNADPAIPGRTTQRYAIYRGRPTDNVTNPEALNDLENPARLATLTPVFVNHSPDAANRIVWVDNVLTAEDPDAGKTRWYAVRAVHDSLCGPVMSAPSPPAFGAFRDRKGLPAPRGFVHQNCPIFAARFLSATTFQRPPLTGQSGDLSRLNRIRLRCIRRDPSVEAVSFSVTPADSQQAVPIGPTTFGPGTSEVSIELDSTASRATIRCQGVDLHLCLSNLAASPLQTLASGATTGTEFLFDTGSLSAVSLNPDNPADAAFLSPIAIASVTHLGNNVVSANLGAAVAPNRSILIQNRTQAGGTWSFAALAQASGASVTFGVRSWPAAAQSWRAFLLPIQPADCPCLHDPSPEGASNTSPVVIVGLFPPGTKEWRIYRKVDNGPMELHLSGIAAIPAPDTLEVSSQDTVLPPQGATLCYYLQSFGESGNPSPLVLIKCVTILPDPGTPVLEQPASTDAGAMSVRWFCPRPGVKNFRVWLAAKENGITPPLTASATAVPPASPYSVSFRRQGAETDESAWAIAAYELPDLAKDGTDSIFSLEFAVAPNQEYIVWVEAIGIKDSTKSESSKRVFTWQQPADSTVAWPARPLPPGVTYFGKAVYFPDVLPGSVAARSTITLEEMEEYPVGIRIGTVQFSGSYAAIPNFSYQSVGLGDSPEAVLTPFPTASGSRSILPFVLYRQTILPDGSPGSLIQTTPLREGIVFTNSIWDWDFSPNTPDSAATTIADPYVRVIVRENGIFDLGELYLVDSQPVEFGASYHYYLVRYRSSSEEAPGEIDTVLDCGIVSIPDSE